MNLIGLFDGTFGAIRLSKWGFSACSYTEPHKNGMDILIKFRHDFQWLKEAPRQGPNLFALQLRSPGRAQRTQTRFQSKLAESPLLAPE